MLPDNSTLLFSFTSCDPEEISWQLSLGKTALDAVDDPEWEGMSAVEACIAKVCRDHRSDAGQLGPDEDKSLRLLIEDALGDTSFQKVILPKLIQKAIAAENLPVVNILVSYAEDQTMALRLANGMEEGRDASEADKPLTPSA